MTHDHEHCKCECCEANNDDMSLNSGDKIADMFAKLAYDAWNSLLIDKMKKIFEKQMGEQIDKIALSTVELSMAQHASEVKNQDAIEAAIAKLHESMKM